MPNVRPQFIPVPKPNLKSKLPTSSASSKQPPIYKKPASTQTDKLVFIKEETLVLSFARIGVNDGGMRRDYLKAVNYINSCHKFINAILEKNCTDKNNLFVLPVITNFIPMFPNLLGKKSAPSSANKSHQHQQHHQHFKDDRRSVDSCKSAGKKYEEKKSGSGSSGRKTTINKKTKAINSPLPLGVGDFSPREEKVQDITDSVKQQLNQFLSNLQEDFLLKTTQQQQQPQKMLEPITPPKPKSIANSLPDDDAIQSNPLPSPPRLQMREDENAEQPAAGDLIINKPKGLKITTYESESSNSTSSSDILTDSENETTII